MHTLRRKYFCLLLMLVMTAGSLLAGCGILPEEEEALAPPLVQPKRTEYELYKVVKKDITKTLTGTGNLVAVDEETLYFTESDGKLKSIDVKLDQEVKKGQVLVRLDTGNLETRIRKQENAAEKAKIQLESQKKLYDKYASMPEDSVITPKEMDDLRKDLKLKEIDLEDARIELEELNRQRVEAVLTSPIDGIVTFIEDLDPGDSIEAYKKVIVVSDPGKLQIYYQPSRDINDVKTGMKVKVKWKGQAYPGEVILSPDNAPKDALEKYKNALVIRVDDLPATAKWGQSIDFTIDVVSKKDVLAIPVKGLRKMVGRTYVQVLDGDTKNEFDVKVGIESDYEVEILSGIKEGQMVILN